MQTTRQINNHGTNHPFCSSGKRKQLCDPPALPKNGKPAYCILVIQRCGLVYDLAAAGYCDDFSHVDRFDHYRLENKATDVGALSYLAITIWITANSYWMISEFTGFDSKPLFGDFTFKHLAMIPFATGILILAFYYLAWKPRHPEEFETM